ncbi:hypothetical protein ACQP10_18355 [Streptosporangium sandarakinum]|uniref:hypothetical protein n=1 Tax=Streptosporangium sandarakinum TaxID=1260955 RepID=UPI003D91E818
MSPTVSPTVFSAVIPPAHGTPVAAADLLTRRAGDASLLAHEAHHGGLSGALPVAGVAVLLAAYLAAAALRRREPRGGAGGARRPSPPGPCCSPRA